MSQFSLSGFSPVVLTCHSSDMPPCFYFLYTFHFDFQVTEVILMQLCQLQGEGIDTAHSKPEVSGFSLFKYIPTIK